MSFIKNVKNQAIDAHRQKDIKKNIFFNYKKKNWLPASTISESGHMGIKEVE